MVYAWVCIEAYIGAPIWMQACPPARMYPPVGTHLPICTQVHPPTDTGMCPHIHPWTWVHGSGEASHPHTTDIPTYTPGRTVICVATSGKKGGPIGKKKGGPSYARADRPMDLGVHVILYTYMWKYTQSGLFGKKDPASMYRWVGGWKKWGPTWEKKGGDPEKPPPDGGKWGWIGDGGEKSPRHLCEPMERARLYGARRDAFGEGDGILPVRHAPVALRYPKSLFRGIGALSGIPWMYTHHYPPTRVYMWRPLPIRA